jgi:hypothetical protein
MFESGNGYSLADIAAATGNNRDNDSGWGDGGAWWIIILFLFVFCGWGNGFGGGLGGGNGANSPGLQGLATRADINEGFALNGIERGIQGIQQGICDSTYALNNSIQQGFSSNQLQLCNGFNGVERSFNQLGYQMQDCCCQTQRAIDGVNYNMAKNTCDVQNTIQNTTRDILESNNSNTRAILDFLTNDKIATLQSENQSLKLAASQSNQNAYFAATLDANTAELIRRLGPTPIPAYTVPAPYPYGVGCGCNSCGC